MVCTEHNLEDHLLALQGMENPLCYFSTKESRKERLLREENARGPKQVGGEGQRAVVTVPAPSAQRVLFRRKPEGCGHRHSVYKMLQIQH